MISLFQSLRDDPLVTLVTLGAMVVATLVTVLPMLVAQLYLVYFVVTLPLRRNERARLFLELLELGIAGGETPERSVINAARSRDLMLGGHIRTLARHLEAGMKLSVGLTLVPRLLPRPVMAMLRAGESIGDVPRVLPACRQLLRDGHSQVQGALNYLILLWCCATPLMLAVPLVLRVKVMPQFSVVFEGMGLSGNLPNFTRFVFDSSYWFVFIAAGFQLLAWFLMFCYAGGPRLTRWVNAVFPGLPDTLAYCLPWRRDRLRRDFSAVLAAALDAGLAEAAAVRLAAESTANRVIERRAIKVCAQLAAGVALPEALKALDDAGELQWRLGNARPARGGFARALAGWHAALDVRAFQREQTAAQVATTTMVLFNGAVIAAFVFAIYMALFQLIQEATLW